MEMSDRQLLHGLARHLRKHEVLCFDPDDSTEQERAEQLIAWFADNVELLNVPGKGEASPTAAADAAAVVSVLEHLGNQSQAELRQNLE